MILRLSIKAWRSAQGAVEGAKARCVSLRSHNSRVSALGAAFACAYEWLAAYRVQVCRYRELTNAANALLRAGIERLLLPPGCHPGSD